MPLCTLRIILTINFSLELAPLSSFGKVASLIFPSASFFLQLFFWSLRSLCTQILFLTPGCSFPFDPSQYLVPPTTCISLYHRLPTSPFFLPFSFRDNHTTVLFWSKNHNSIFIYRKLSSNQSMIRVPFSREADDIGPKCLGDKLEGWKNLLYAPHIR